MCVRVINPPPADPFVTPDDAATYHPEPRCKCNVCTSGSLLDATPVCNVKLNVSPGFACKIKF